MLMPPATREGECFSRIRGYQPRDAMGTTHVTVAVRNPAEPERVWEGLFLIDTGAVDCLVPAKHLRAIGLKPKGERTYELADGSEVKLDISTADIEFMG